MKHLFLTNKHGKRIIIHHEALKEAFPTSDGKASVCVVDVRKSKGDASDTFMVVSESTENIGEQLKNIREGAKCPSVPPSASEPSAESN